MADNEIEFGMWNIKGIAEPTRWVFLHFGLNVKEWNPANEAEWEEKKKTLNTNFPNLPYIKDGDFILTETNALGPYLAEKAGRLDFLGNDIHERAQVRMLEGVLLDIRLACFAVLQLPKEANHRDALANHFLDNGPMTRKIRTLSEFLGEKEWFLGHLTWADFMLTFTARFCGAMCYSLLGYSPFADFPNIVALMARVSNLPGIYERLTGPGLPAPYLPAEKVPFKFLNFKEMIEKGLNPI